MTRTIVLKISGMHCASCAMDIDMTLEEMDGILEASTSYARSETQVKFDPDRVNEDKITGIIKTVGYDVS